MGWRDKPQTRILDDPPATPQTTKTLKEIVDDPQYDPDLLQTGTRNDLRIAANAEMPIDPRIFGDKYNEASAAFVAAWDAEVEQSDICIKTGSEIHQLQERLQNERDEMKRRETKRIECWHAANALLKQVEEKRA